MKFLLNPKNLPVFSIGTGVMALILRTLLFLLSRDEKNLLIKTINSMNERERTIMSMRFGLDGGKEHTQKEVADILGISQSYISRLEKRIIERLRREIEKVS